MTIHKTATDGKLALSLEGRVDTITSPELQTELMRAITEASNVEIDFAKVQYISSAGLRVLLMGQKKANEQKKSMTVSNVPPEVMEVLEMTGFASILTLI